jgi:hypothetical protein
MPTLIEGLAVEKQMALGQELIFEGKSMTVGVQVPRDHQMPSLSGLEEAFAAVGKALGWRKDNERDERDVQI